MVCYPIGAGGEMWTMLDAAGVISENYVDRYSYKLPNKWNMSFYTHYFFYCLVVAYVLVFPQLYSYLLQ